MPPLGFLLLSFLFYVFSIKGMQMTIDRYFKYTKEVLANKPETEEYIQQLQHDIANMVKEIEHIEVSQRRLLGQDLGSCSVEDLQDIDGQLEKSLRSIRARKAQLFKEQIEQLKAKEKLLLEENARLSLKASTQQKGVSVTHKSQISQSSEIETELFIGPTEIRFF